MKLLRGRTLSFTARPSGTDDARAYEYHTKGAVVLDAGKILFHGRADDAAKAYPEAAVLDYGEKLIVPGFIDTHTHFTQARIIASYGETLLGWLKSFTFPEEARFENAEHASRIAEIFLDESIRHGTTTAVVYGSVHETSAHAFFEASERRNMRMICGNVLMDKNADPAICVPPQDSYDASKRVIERWHNRSRLRYAVTPRFAITSSEELLEISGALLREHPDCFLQTHLSETENEVAETKKLFPNDTDYLGIYERFGLLGERSLFGHCIYLEDREKQRLAETNSVAVFCPTSNLFLGSGFFNFRNLDEAGIRVSLATDVGAGTSYSMLATLSESYKVSRSHQDSLDPFMAFYMITRGNAEALGLENCIGTLDAGSEADIVVLDSQATNAMALRMELADSLADELFVLQTLGDDRSVVEVFVAGKPQLHYGVNS